MPTRERLYMYKPDPMLGLVKYEADAPSILIPSPVAPRDGRYDPRGFSFLGGAVLLEPRAYQEFEERERQVAILAALGVEVPAIGDMLFLTQHTAKTYLSRVYRKTYEGQRNRGRFALLHAMVSADTPFATVAKPATDRRMERLDEKHSEVVGAAFEGKSNDKIATAVGLAPRAVRPHLETAFQQAGVTCRELASAGWLLTHASVELELAGDQSEPVPEAT